MASFGPNFAFLAKHYPLLDPKHYEIHHWAIALNMVLVESYLDAHGRQQPTRGTNRSFTSAR